MLYGAIAASVIRPSIFGISLFSGAGNLTVAASIAENPARQGSASFAGAGQMAPRGFIVLSGEEVETAAWADAVVNVGGTVSQARRTLVNNLIAGLKADSLWTKFSRLWLLAAENSESALTDLVTGAHATLTAPNPSFTSDRGFTGTGTNGSINTGFNQASGGLATQNDTHFSMWSNTNPLPTAATGEYCGADPGGGGSYWLYYLTNNSFYFRTNDNGNATAVSSDFATHAGHFISSRASSTQRMLYLNGSLKYTTSATSQAVPNINHSIITSGFSHQVSAYSIGSNLNGGSDAINFYNRLKAYMLAVGIAVQEGSASLGGAGSMNVDGTVI